MSDQKKWISVAIVSASFILALSAAPVIAHGPGHDDDHDMCKHCEEKMSKMDTDGDGKISRREFMKHHGDMFDKHDLNNDRFLDMDEMHWMMEDMHEHMHSHDHKNGDGHGHGHGHGHGEGHDHHGGHGKGHGHGDDHGKDHGEGHGHEHDHGDEQDREHEEHSPHGSHGDAKHGDHD